MILFFSQMRLDIVFFFSFGAPVHGAGKGFVRVVQLNLENLDDPDSVAALFFRSIKIFHFLIDQHIKMLQI